jgi:ubiquinone/menaquinone biosynthesis C-methylase UbiE
LHVRISFDDEKERRKWQNPETILADVVGVETGFTLVDVGCGDGFFALPAARFVGNEGRVYGLDADSEAIGRLKEEAAKEGLRNLQLKVGMAEETVFCDSCADIIFFRIVLHDFGDPTRVLLNAKKMLKPTGRLIDLDLRKEPMRFGPPLHIRFNEQKASNLIETTGFKIDEIKKEGLYHYIIVATPESSLASTEPIRPRTPRPRAEGQNSIDRNVPGGRLQLRFILVQSLIVEHDSQKRIL